MKLLVYLCRQNENSSKLFQVRQVMWKNSIIHNNHRRSMKSFAILCVLIYSSICQFSSNPSTVFAETFNLPIFPTKTPSQIPPLSQKSSSQPPKTTPLQTSLNTIKNLALKYNVPSKSVIDADTGHVFLITQQEEGFERNQISNFNAVKRLYDNATLLKINSTILKEIPRGKALDKFAQLIKVKGQQQVYLVRQGIRDLVSPAEFANFGFTKKYILQIQPCFVNTFVERDQLK